MSRLSFPVIQLLDSSGATAGSGTLTFYAKDTTTLQDTYSNAAETLTNENPITVNGSGLSGPVYLQYLDYTILAQDSDGITLWEEGFDGRWLANGNDYTNSATGSIGRTVQSKLDDVVHIADFGATGDGSDESAAFVLAAAALSSRGGTLMLDAKTYKIGSTVTFGGQIIIQGQGIEATRVSGAADTQPFIFDNGGLSSEPVGGGLKDMSYSLAGNSSVLPIGLSIIDCWDFQVERVRFRDGGTNGVTDTIKGSGGSYGMGIRDCRFAIGGTSSNRCIYLADDCNSSEIVHCDFAPEDGGTAILVEDCTTMSMIGNRFEYAGGEGGKHIDVNNCNGTAIIGNQVGANDGTTGSGDVQIDIRGTSQHTQISGNRINLATTISGIRLGDTVHSISITGNSILMTGGTSGIETGGRSNISIVGNNWYFAANIAGSGIDVNTGQNLAITGNTFLGAGSPTTAIGITLDSGTANTTITGNAFKKLTVGIDTDVSSGGPTVIMANNIFNSNTADIEIATASSNKVNDNVGFITEASGTAVIASGGVTSGNIAHGCDYTPDAADITITPTNDPTNDPGHFFVDSVDGTNIVIKCGADPGVSTATLSWSVRRR